MTCVKIEKSRALKIFRLIVLVLSLLFLVSFVFTFFQPDDFKEPQPLSQEEKDALLEDSDFQNSKAALKFLTEELTEDGRCPSISSITYTSYPNRVVEIVLSSGQCLFFRHEGNSFTHISYDEYLSLYDEDGDLIERTFKSKELSFLIRTFQEERKGS